MPRLKGSDHDTIAWRSLSTGRTSCKSPTRTSSTWQNTSMGNNDSSDTRWRSRVTRVLSLRNPILEPWIQRWRDLSEMGQRTVLWLWWLGCSCWNLVWKWVKLIWRSLRAWWLVTKIRIDENPVTEGLVLVALFFIAGFVWVAGNHDVEPSGWPSLFKDITVNKVANPWRDAIKVRLLDNGKLGPSRRLSSFRSCRSFSWKVG